MSRHCAQTAFHIHIPSGCLSNRASLFSSKCWGEKSMNLSSKAISTLKLRQAGEVTLPKYCMHSLTRDDACKNKQDENCFNQTLFWGTHNLNFLLKVFLILILFVEWPVSPSPKVLCLWNNFLFFWLTSLILQPGCAILSLKVLLLSIINSPPCKFYH